MSEEQRNQHLEGMPHEPPGSGHGPRKLYRSSRSRVLGGVCGGLGEYFDVDPLLFRVGWVFLGLMGGMGVLAYLAAWIFLPEQPGTSAARLPDPERSRKLGLFAGAVLVCIGSGLLLSQLGWFYPDLPHLLHIQLNLILPLFLVGFGIYLILNRGGVKLRLPSARAGAGDGKKLTRSIEDRRIAGVCGGLATYFGIDSTWVRLGAIFLVVFTHLLGVIAYLALMIAMPEEPRELSHHREGSAPSA